MKGYILFATFALICLMPKHLKASDGTEQRGRTPSRVEKKSYSNISEVKIDHKYGNIIVRESSSSQVDLEIQYFDQPEFKASCNITQSRNVLLINSVNSFSDNATITYILSIPKSTMLDVNLNYGNIDLDRLASKLTVKLLYGNLNAKAILNSESKIMGEYNNVKISESKDLDFALSYSDLKLGKGNKVNIRGEYSNCKLGEINSIDLKILYGDFKADILDNALIMSEYTDMVIGNLGTALNAKINYGDLKINAVSSRLSNIDVISNYGDISVALPTDISLAFDVALNYGDFKVSNKYSVKYIHDVQKDNSVLKQGNIGSRTPTAKMNIKANYANISIK